MKLLSKIKNKFLGSNNVVSRNALRLKRKYKIQEFNKKDKKVLEICGGSNPFKHDNLNVDVMDHPLVDVVANLSDKLPFDDQSIDVIISIATLEHFNIDNLRGVLDEFGRMLKSGGRLEIGVPSLTKIFEYWKTNSCDDNVVRYLHGAQKDQYDLHLAILDFNRWKKELIKSGFIDINEVEYDYPFHSKDFMMKILSIKQ